MKDFHVSIFFLANLTTKFLMPVLIHLLRKMKTTWFWKNYEDLYLLYSFEFSYVVIGTYNHFLAMSKRMYMFPPSWAE